VLESQRSTQHFVRKRTNASTSGMSAKCEKRTFKSSTITKKKNPRHARGFDNEREISKTDGSSRRYDERNASDAALDVGSADIVSMQISKIMVV